MNPALVFFESLLLLLEFTRNFVAVIKIHGLMSHTIQIRPKIIFKKNEEDEEAKKREGERKALTLSNGKESSPSQVHIHTMVLCVALNTNKYFGQMYAHALKCHSPKIVHVQIVQCTFFLITSVCLRRRLCVSVSFKQVLHLKCRANWSETAIKSNYLKFIWA